MVVPTNVFDWGGSSAKIDQANLFYSSKLSSLVLTEETRPKEEGIFNQKGHLTEQADC